MLAVEKGVGLVLPRALLSAAVYDTCALRPQMEVDAQAAISFVMPRMLTHFAPFSDVLVAPSFGPQMPSNSWTRMQGHRVLYLTCKLG